jgi:hypothetical protein
MPPGRPDTEMRSSSAPWRVTLCLQRRCAFWRHAFAPAGGDASHRNGPGINPAHPLGFVGLVVEAPGPGPVLAC